MDQQMPGGRLFGEGVHKSTALENFRNEMLKAFSITYTAEASYLHDEHFLQRLTELENPKKYIEETIKFRRNDPTVDKQYVLVFRRTIPKDKTPCPEKHWGTDFIQIRNGLRKEISGEHRQKSVIYVSTLGLLEQETGSQPTFGGFTDGEIQIGDKAVDLDSISLFSFKPDNDT